VRDAFAARWAADGPLPPGGVAKARRAEGIGKY